MALSKSALSDLLDALRAGGDLDIIREALALVLQALIDAEATQHIGARPYERTEQRTAHRNAPAPGCCPPRPAMSSCASPSCGRARSSPPCWSRAAASTGRCWPW
jgi:Transposase, Mutator family